MAKRQQRQHSSAMSFIKGGQTFFYKATMLRQNITKILCWSVLFYALIFVGTLFLVIPFKDLHTIWIQIYAQTLYLVSLGDHIIATINGYHYSAYDIATNLTDKQYFYFSLILVFSESLRKFYFFDLKIL